MSPPRRMKAEKMREFKVQQKHKLPSWGQKDTQTSRGSPQERGGLFPLPLTGGTVQNRGLGEAFVVEWNREPSMGTGGSCLLRREVYGDGKDPARATSPRVDIFFFFTSPWCE